MRGKAIVDGSKTSDLGDCVGVERGGKEEGKCTMERGGSDFGITVITAVNEAGRDEAG